MALAYLGLPPKQFGELRIPEFWAAIDTHNEEKNADRRHIGELVRGAALRLWNLQVKKNCRISEPSKFWAMPWDEEEHTTVEVAHRIKSLTDEERDKMAKEFIEKLNGK